MFLTGTHDIVLRVMKRYFLLILFAFVFVPSFSQDESEDLGFRESFVEGNQLMEEFNYSVALDLWLDLIKQQPANANVSYKAGLCLWKLPKKKQEALPYFQAAVKNVNERYDPFSPSEQGSPIETYYYISNAYHLDNQFDTAIVYYNKFKNQINHNHEFWARTDLEIAMCEVAKEAVLNPVDIEVINLGSLVNSQYPDYAPVVSVDETVIYFTSKRLRKDSSNIYAFNQDDGEFYEDVYVTYKGPDGAWEEPEGLNFNSTTNEATLSLSADGTTMYIYKPGQSGYGDIYESKLVDTTWTDPSPLGSDINSIYHETHAAVTPDGQRLYYISNRKGSLKFPDKAHEKIYSKDIYFCNLLPTGEWALSQPLTEVNTPFHEEGVIIHPDGKTMYFSSEGHGSIGGYDIFVSELQADSTWGKPKNIGYPINTTDDDIFFVVSASGKRAYYSSSRQDGQGDKDLYVISMLSFKEKPLTLLIGRITSANNTPVPDGIVINVTDNNTNEPVGSFKPRSRDNKFTIIIPPGSDYHLDYVYGDSVFYKDDIFVPANSSYQEIEKAISLGGIDFSGIEKAAQEKKDVEAAASSTIPHSVSTTPSIEGKLKYGAAGATGVLLNLTDANNQRVSQTTTDGSGSFVFRNLQDGSKYFVVIDQSNGTIPPNAQLYIKDAETGTMIPVSKLADGKFAFETLPYMSPEELQAMEVKDEEKKPEGVVYGSKQPKVDGNLKYGGVAAGGVVIDLNDNNKKKLASTKTNEKGDFTFTNLDAGTKYALAIDPKGGSVPGNAQIFLRDSETGQVLPVSKLADGSFGFETLPYMAAPELEKMEETEDRKVSQKALKEVPPPSYKTEVQEVDGEKYILHEVRPGETMFTVSLLYNLRFHVVQSANPGMGDLIHEGDLIRLPVPAGVNFYQEFFDYNVSDVKPGGSDYLNFISQVENAVKDKGKATLMIESSSSKVPSARFDGNKNLSVKRADNARSALVKSMSEKNIGSDKLNFADVSTLIRGPEFNNDAQENKATYRSFQYVKIIVK